MSLADLTLLRPLWLLALPVIAALAVLASRRQTGPGDWAARIDPHLMAAMAALGRVDRSGSRALGLLPFWAAGLTALALSGPAFQRDDARTFRNLSGAIFVVDVSGSMARDAAWPRTLNMVQAGLRGLGTKPAALIVYAGDSYVAAPLTTDHRELGHTVALLDDGTVPDRGNRPALALADALKLLEQGQILAGDVVWVTDGDGLGPEVLNLGKSIAAQGARLSVVQARTEKGGRDSAAFAPLLLLGGGQLYALDDAPAMMADLGTDRDTRLEEQRFALLFWQDYGRFLLLLALVPVAALFVRERA